MEEKVYRGSAPGRLDFMGGVADYSGSLVLQIPIAAKTEVTVRALNEPCLRFESADRDEFAGCELPLSPELLRCEDYAVYTAALDRSGAPRWICYVAVSRRAREGEGRADALGSGLRSAVRGAALRRCQQQRRQLAAAYGRQDAVLPILCRPDILSEPVDLPGSSTVVGWPSGVRHDIGASPYEIARAATFIREKDVRAAYRKGVVLRVRDHSRRVTRPGKGMHRPRLRP